jgi:glutathione peroxidase
MSKSVYEIPVKRINGQETTLADYQGKVLLLVNVASKCGLTPQYEGLESVYNQYKGQGFEVLGFPANNFLGQEPGTEAEIQEFCSLTYNVSFPLFSKISVVGEGQHPLYQYLTTVKPEAQGNGDDTLVNKLAELGQTPKQANDILWNFEKFLVNREGQVVARFAPNVKPSEAIITQAIETELKKEPVAAQ